MLQQRNSVDSTRPVPLGVLRLSPECDPSCVLVARWAKKWFLLSVVDLKGFENTLARLMQAV